MYHAINVLKFIDHAIGKQSVRGKAIGIRSREGTEVEITLPRQKKIGQCKLLN